MWSDEVQNWLKKNRPDGATLAYQLKLILEGDQNERKQSYLGWMAIAFEAGRAYQNEHPDASTALPIP